MGATYGVNAFTELSNQPHGEYSAMIQFTSTPAQADTRFGLVSDFGFKQLNRRFVPWGQLGR